MCLCSLFYKLLFSSQGSILKEKMDLLKILNYVPVHLEGSLLVFGA